LPNRHIVLSVLLFQEPDRPDVWIIQALERDIAAFGADVESAKRAFERTVSAYLTHTPPLTDPLSQLKPAPAMFWDMWRSRAAETVQAERMPSIPAFMMPVVSHEPLQA
jgi:hypothetical protein